MRVDHDILIVGGGMVGATLACALAGQGWRIAVLEQRPPPPFVPDHYDLRVSAITVASQRVFTAVGAWPGMVARRACPFRRMRVWEAGAGTGLGFDSADLAEPHLGHIVENSVVQLALFERMQALPEVESLCPAEIAEIDTAQGRVTLADGRTLRARLLVAADGGNSRVREAAGIACDTFAYPQHALVATVATQLPQQDITWQCYVPGGPLAFLPLVGQRASLVWYAPEVEVKRLLALPDGAFRAAAEAAFPPELGGIAAVLERGAFPLVRRQAEAYVRPRLALVGDAAHTIHPQVGQGVNLGVLDAATLAEVLAECAHAGGDPGALRPLRRYERWRRGNNVAVVSFSEAVYHGFAHPSFPARALRNAALTAAQICSPVNRLCMSYAMGMIGDLPRLARGRSLERP
jgi:2-octaprenyl-3-methyl-6-methoxy-1,4-benzoquinol hydroxylase